MKVLQVILAHTDSQEIFDRHLPIWMANDATTMVVAREGFGVKTDLEQVFIGKRGRGGPEAGRAYAALLRYLCQFKVDYYDLFILNEYDSFCLSREIPVPFGFIGGNLFEETDPKTVFKAKYYIHFPVVFRRCGLELIVQRSSRIPDESEGGHCDRYLGYLCELSGIHTPVTDWRIEGIGFSQNTIEPNQIKDAAEAASRGAVMFHGVKSKECLQAIATAHLNRTLGKSIDLGKIAIPASL